jgi:hypothetical protein
MSIRKVAVAIGLLFFVQMATAMKGLSLIDGFVAGDADKGSLTLSALLMTCSGLAVVAIGVLAYRVLKPFNQRLAIWYPVMRVIECITSVACSVYLLVTLQVVPNHMLLVYIPTVIGGLVFTYLLWASRIVPWFIAGLGLAGYSSLGLGTVLSFLGDVDLNSLPGFVLLIPGFAFEFALLPLYLLIKGFKKRPFMAIAA